MLSLAFVITIFNIIFNYKYPYPKDVLFCLEKAEEDLNITENFNFEKKSYKKIIELKIIFEISLRSIYIVILVILLIVFIILTCLIKKKH